MDAHTKSSTMGRITPFTAKDHTKSLAGEAYVASSTGNGRRAPRRVVLKVGSRLLTGGTIELQRDRMETIVSVIARHRETETVLVSSGAIAAGLWAFGLQKPPMEAAQRRAVAAVGQASLTRVYTELFHAYGIRTGQVLLTKDAFREPRLSSSLSNAFAACLRARVVPIVNENHTSGVEDTEIGDNDNLAAYSAGLVGADVLVLLTDMDGVYDGDPAKDPGARLIRHAATASALRQYCWTKPAVESIGGLATKLDAVERAAGHGIPTIIASGLVADAIEAVYAGDPEGTLISAVDGPFGLTR